MIRAAVLVAALAGCGVKAAPRPPERPAPPPRERRADAPPAGAPIAASASGDGGCCARPDPILAATATRP